MKIPKAFLCVLILGGIAMSILNFSTMAYAQPTIYGTMTIGDGTLAEGTWYLAGRWVGDFGSNLWYCCEDPSNCCIVFAN
ncbi:MAG: hypothetical protein SCM96_13910 [Acidobacteriota bacterium]|nr:hypothetical protein [Acidobacteriota bacterium]